MRTEREIKAKLRYLENQKKKNPTFWNVLVLNIYTDCLDWFRRGKSKKGGAAKTGLRMRA